MTCKAKWFTNANPGPKGNSKIKSSKMLWVMVSLLSPNMTSWRTILIWMYELCHFFKQVLLVASESYIPRISYITHGEEYSHYHPHYNPLAVSWSPWTKCSFSGEQDHSWIADQINQCHHSCNDILRNMRVLTERIKINI